MTKEEKKNMSIANCRICSISKSNCAECPLNWALDLLDIEKTLKIQEIPLNIEITDEWIENNPDDAMESL